MNFFILFIFVENNMSNKVSEHQNKVAILQNFISVHEKRLEAIKQFCGKETNPMDNNTYYNHYLFLYNINKQKLALIEMNRYLTSVRNPVLDIRAPKKFLYMYVRSVQHLAI
jgi:hypothetical protein